MLSERIKTELLNHSISFQESVSLAKHTYWRIGGPADAVVTVNNLSELQTLMRAAHAASCPVFPLGNASNLLISDKGIRGIVLFLSGELAQCTSNNETPPVLQVGAGMKLIPLLSRAKKAGWTGLGCFAGIPGTLGGAIRMNAGASLGETKDCLLRIQAVLSNGDLAELSKNELNMSYRTTHLPKGAIIAKAWLQTTGLDTESDKCHIAEHLKRRKETQPLHLPSCGSTFRNPPGDHAGRLIEAAGLKGLQIGQAQISEKHANFIVNLGGAKASDVRKLIETIEEKVQDQFGILLEREVHFAGEF